MDLPTEVELPLDCNVFRMVASKFPPIKLFEDIAEPEDLDILYELEARTNRRHRQEIGDLNLVPRGDRVVGPGSSPLMAPFTHVGRESRFSDGSYGVYYAGLDLQTAIKETVFHREKFLASTKEGPQEIDMRSYITSVLSPLNDIRDKTNKHYVRMHNPDDYSSSQTFAKQLRVESSNGIFYRSVRHDGGECVAIFRPAALNIPTQGKHYTYVWDGEAVSDVYEKKWVD